MANRSKTTRVSKKFNICLTQKFFDDISDEWIRERVELTERVLAVVIPHLQIDPHVRVVFDFLKTTHAFTTSVNRVGNTPKLHVTIDPRIFDYDEDSTLTSKQWFVEVLCHELIHVEQGEKGYFRMKDVPNGKRIAVGYWYGVEYSYHYADADAYLNAPWEIDANGRQQQVAKLFWKSVGKKEPKEWSDWE